MYLEPPLMSQDNLIRRYANKKLSVFANSHYILFTQTIHTAKFNNKIKMTLTVKITGFLMVSN